MKKIFVHIPKNGGTSIRRPGSGVHNQIINSNRHTAVKMEYTPEQLDLITMNGKHPGYQHLRWRDFRPHLRNEYPAFTIVRNPWSRVVSRYTFTMKHREVLLPHRPEDYTFEEFLDERYIWNNIPFLWLRATKGWYQQLEYVVDDNGKLVCDVLRFEHFDEDIKKYFNLEVKIAQVNSSDNKIDYKTFYTEETKQIIADWYKDDINFFGFTFEGTATKNTWNKK